MRQMLPLCRLAAVLAPSTVLLCLLAPGRSDAQAGYPPRFQTADRCMACHNGLSSPSGQDVSIGTSWGASMMANAARDPYWQAGVRREVTIHPRHAAAIQDECSTCHMPMARFQAHAAGQMGRVFANLPTQAQLSPLGRLAADGASCTVCHQIQAANLGRRESFVGGFVIDTLRPMGQRQAFGPYDTDRGRARVMSSSSGLVPSRGTHVKSSELCATCHTLITQAFGSNGEPTGELPEQVPYLEWLNSGYRETQSCQACHMPAVVGPVPISSVLPQPRPALATHAFRGGNAFMLRLLGQHAATLNVQARTYVLAAAAMSTQTHLEQESADLSVSSVSSYESKLEFDVVVRSRAGHKLPTAYPSRRVWLHVAVLDPSGRKLFESGRPEQNGAIAANDNDADAQRYERHYQRIERPSQVQIYEAIMAGPTGAITTSLLTATHYVKDNRLLPIGFNKEGRPDQVAVHGEAQGDADFEAGGDRVRYVVSRQGHQGPFRIVAELWYQPIGFRWAENLADTPSPESRKFLTMYRPLSPFSATRLASARAVAR